MLKKELKGLLIVFLLAIFFPSKAEALLYEGKIKRAEYINNTFIHKERSDGYYQYYQAHFLRKSTDDNYVYCLEPFVDIKDNYTYEMKEQDYANLLNLSPEDWHKIELLAYYGYMYQDDIYRHLEVKWYYITQIEIWRVVDKTINIYYTDKLNGNKIERFEEEFQELRDIVAKHDTLPDVKVDFNLSIGNEYTYPDLNEVLKTYDIDYSYNIRVKKDGNNLVINTLVPGDAYITFIKKGIYQKDPVLYFSQSIQKTLEVGDYPPISKTISFRVNGSKVKIIKVDSQTNNNIKLANIKFQILNSLNEPVCQNDVCEFLTDNEGMITLDKPLGFGTYKLVELDSSMPGYLLNNEALEFTIDENSGEEVVLHYPNTRAKGLLNITKYGQKVVFENDTFGYEEILLDDVVFDIYASNDIIIGGNKLYSKDDLITSVTTKDGKASVTLELGEYYLIEKKSSNNNLVDSKPIYFSLNYIDNTTEVVLKDIDIHNIYPKGKLVFIKEDEITKERLQGAKIAIYNEEQELIYTGETDSDGKLEISDLPVGHYFLKELSAPDGYILKEEMIPFEIKENMEVVKITLANKKRPVPTPTPEPEPEPEPTPEPEEEIEPDVKDYYVTVPDTNLAYNYDFVYIIPRKKFGYR